MDERERQRRILNFIYAQPDIPTSVRHAFRQWMADQERNPEVDRLMEELWETNDAEASPEKIRKGLDRLHAKIRRSRLRRVLRYAGAAAAAVLMFAGGYFFVRWLVDANLKFAPLYRRKQTMREYRMIDKDLLRLLGGNKKYIGFCVGWMVLGLFANVGITASLC